MRAIGCAQLAIAVQPIYEAGEAVATVDQGLGPVATGRDGSAHHSLHEPG
jgi:hypothetical protein